MFCCIYRSLKNSFNVVNSIYGLILFVHNIVYGGYPPMVSDMETDPEEANNFSNVLFEHQLHYEGYVKYIKLLQFSIGKITSSP